MADYVSPDQRRRIAGGLMAAQYAENPPAAPMGYDFDAAPLSPGLMNFAAQRGQPGVIQKTLGLIPGFDQDGKRGAQSWGNALMSTAQFPIDAVAGMGQALTAPARAYRGEFDPVSEEGVGEALNVAGNAMMGGLAAPKPRNVVGSAGGSLVPDTPGVRAYRGSNGEFQLRDFDPSKSDPSWRTNEGALFFGSKDVGNFYGAPQTAFDQQLYSSIYKKHEKPDGRINPQAIQKEYEAAAPQEGMASVMPADINTSNFGTANLNGYRWERDEGARLKAAIDAAKAQGRDGLTINGMMDASGYPDTQYAVWGRGNVTSPLSGETLYANGGRPGAATGAALGAIPDTPGIRATNISDISTAGPLPNRILAYHGAASKFDNLDLARAPDVGLHYGTLDVTDQFSGFRDYGDKRGVRAPDNSRIYPVILDGSRMARAADGALFDETAQAHSFLDAVKKGKIEGVTNATPGFADLERNMSALPYGDASANPIVRDWLTSNGLDGVIYPNTYDGSGVSAMMWKNVRSALGNNDLLYANGGRGGAATGAALGAIPDTPGIRAYHGSPHDFDKFDLSKIGTGEGAQAYGHGLYFAESEGVAKWYRDNLGGKGAPTIAGMRKNYGTLTVGGKRQDAMSRNEALAASNYNIAKGDADKATSITAKDLPKLEARLAATVDADEIKSITQLLTQKQEIISHIEAMRGQPIGRAAPGRMYEVNIKANPDDFLDWDKPLSQQSEKVQRLLGDQGAGQEAYARLAQRQRQGERTGNPLDDVLFDIPITDHPTAARRLREAGIPGIRYLDQGSRAGGEGSRNLVVFDDKLIEILRKYGLLGMAGGAAAAEYGGNSLMPSRPASPQYRPGDA